MAQLMISKPTIQKILNDKKSMKKINKLILDKPSDKNIMKKDFLEIMIKPNVDKTFDKIVDKNIIKKDFQEIMIKSNVNKTFDKILTKKLKNPNSDFLFNFKKNNANKLNGFQKYYSNMLEVIRNHELEQEGKATLEAVKDAEFNYMTGDFGLAMAEMFKKAAALFKRQ